MKNKLAAVIFIIYMIFTFMFAMFFWAFFKWDVNPGNWKAIDRIFVFVFWIILTMLPGAFSKNDDHQNLS